MPLNDRVRDQINDAIFAGHKIEAIKHYREATGAGLKESKEFIDALTEELREKYPDKVPKQAGCGTAVLLFVATVGSALYYLVA